MSQSYSDTQLLIDGQWQDAASGRKIPVRNPASGEVIGSPRYMSAEQASGSKHVDHRTDIYSWGVVAFHMLAGRVPFDDEGVQAILYKQMSVEPPDLRALRPDLPKDLTEAIHRCMAKDPAHRWQNVLDAARAMGCTV